MRNLVFLLIFLGLASVAGQTHAGPPLKVFILAGQSNMQGHAALSTLDAMADDPTTALLLREMRKPDGSLRACKNTWISSIGCAGDGWSDCIEQMGRLTAGFGASPEKFGPEWTFGIFMEEQWSGPILIIKTAWGGRSLHTDFHPPSADPVVPNDYMRARWQERADLDPAEEAAKIHENIGVFYRHMIEHTRSVLKDINRVVPDYDPKDGWELAGFVWFQGWNDYCGGWVYPDQDKPGGYDAYTTLLEQFIRDVRRDLSAPEMPFVIGVMGVGGEREGEKNAAMRHFRKAQIAPTLLPEFRDNVVAVQTTSYWDDELDDLHEQLDKFHRTMDEEFRKTPDMTQVEQDAAAKRAMDEQFTPDEQKRMQGFSNGGYHYLGAAKIMAPIGKAFAEAIQTLPKNSEK
jgi:Domain of unknown function (DUF303).